MPAKICRNKEGWVADAEIVESNGRSELISLDA
jgi:hypothetical protein